MRWAASPRTRRIGTLVAALLAIGANPGLVMAARAWSLGATPTSLVVGVPTTVSLIVTNTGGDGGGDEMTCVRVTVPSSFTVTGASIVSVRGELAGPAVSAWQVVRPGGNLVAFKNPADNYPLVGSTPPIDRAIFTITGIAASPGTMTWTAEAFDKPGSSGTTNCGSGDFPILATAFTVVGLTPTPTPAPTPTPTLAPTPTPTPRPTPMPTSTPILPLPSVPLPSVPLPSLPSGSTQSPSPSVREATAPDASPEPSDRGPGVAVTGGGDAGSGPDAAPTAVQRDRSQAPRIAFDEGALDLGTVGVDLIGEFEVWTVPAATLGVPGILLLVWVALQTVGALAWIPAVRRLRDAEDAPE